MRVTIWNTWEICKIHPLFMYLKSSERNSTNVWNTEWFTAGAPSVCSMSKLPAVHLRAGVSQAVCTGCCGAVREKTLGTFENKIRRVWKLGEFLQLVIILIILSLAEHKLPGYLSCELLASSIMFYISRYVLSSCLCSSWAQMWSLERGENELDAELQTFIK